MNYISVSTRNEVRGLARDRCEYCLLGASYGKFPHEFDHIIATQHGGVNDKSNVCIACFDCNRQKGPNLCSVDLETSDIVRLFDPRHQQWDEHFRLNGSLIEPMTPIARATVRLLLLNDQARIIYREQLLSAGLYP